MEVMGTIWLRWAGEFLLALADLDLSAFASDLASTALAVADDPQVTYVAVQYCVIGDIIFSRFRSDCRGSRFGSIFGVFSGLKQLLGS